jgi:hypothetical protein
VNSTNTSIDATVSSPANSHAEAFIASALQLPEIVGKKQAEERGVPTTGTALMNKLAETEVLDIMIPEPVIVEMINLVQNFKTTPVRNDFEQNVVKHTLESLRIGRVEPRSAAFVAWAGKVYRDRMAAEAAVAEALPPGTKLWGEARCDGIRRVNTSFGWKAVHSFTTKGGHKLEWWTDLKVGDFDEDGNLVPAIAAGVWIDFNCRIKGSSLWNGKLTYKITHAKWDERVAADLAPKPAPKFLPTDFRAAPAAAPAAAAPAAPKAAPAIAPEPLPF